MKCVSVRAACSGASHTVLAFTRTDTSEEGRLTRQFFNDWCSATSAWTTFPAGFLGGMTDVENEVWRRQQTASPLLLADCRALPPKPRSSALGGSPRVPRRWQKCSQWRSSRGTRPDALQRDQTSPILRSTCPKLLLPPPRDISPRQADSRAQRPCS